MTTWYSTITNKGSAHEQGLIIEESTGNAVAVSYKSENAKLIAAAPAMFELLQKLYDARVNSTQDLRIESYAIDELLNNIDGGSR